MKAIRKFTVRTVLPESLGALDELAGNLRWSWHEPTRQLFEHIAPELWRETGTDPVALLGAVDTARLAQLAADSDYVAWANSTRDELRSYLQEPRWYQGLEGEKPASIAYFSPEFGIAAALPQYSGGLGILAGDHLKSASDLGVPLVGVGLFYRAGYFSQAISPDGWQLESYPLLDPDGLPLSVLRRADGSAVQVSLALPDDRTLHARVWQAMVGRIRLLMLDTDIPENADDLRLVTDRLYGGGGEHRLLQELLLGIGGARAVKIWSNLNGQADPEVFHTNEGHAGFLGLERISSLIGEGLSFAEALQVARAGTVFTTHTPVAAGIDRFERSLVRRYFETDLLPGVAVDDLLALGAENFQDGNPDVFNMALMGLRLGQRANGVSKLHGEVSRVMFKGLWPGFDAVDVPIASITNGVHAPTWTDPALMALAQSRLGTSDTSEADWASPAVSDEDLWQVRGQMRRQFVEDARRRIAAAWLDQNPGSIVPSWIGKVFDPNVLTIGFARRVPTYKRLTLMLHDPERLRALLLHAEHPIQIVIAGKSHPADEEGKRLIQRIVQFAADPALRTKIAFLPDYNIGMAQLMYPGTDVWLNNPLRPLEACGTSGMKAALNGALNLSILDGWWPEYYDGNNGWAIPTADAAGDAAERDRLEADALYELIEHQVAPKFYDRNADGVPERWVGSIRQTLAKLSPELNAGRMVRQYVQELYRPAGLAEARLAANNYRAARELAAWKGRIVSAWPGVAVTHVESGGVATVPQVGDELHLRAHVQLNGLTPEDVTVEVVYGKSLANDDLSNVSAMPLDADAEARPGGSPTLFTGTLELDRGGAFGYTVRVVPRNALLVSPAEMGLIAVAS
ncbi:glycosyltransferase family 1 protein [Cryobacterium sp. TMT1-21]|uniref:glycogen phosphorylase n=1 Tax=Cryobacterium shii TaxID=1259235 RepID=A0AAQ2C8R8_9MICO|nr:MULTISPECIES: alpha-glucan family phosphorylase [Cryobacterium]TFC52389.1 glycosyltransferase family 1 protein [Cryobacterium shii]TFC87481.1 glycosyltransferase family 1 protein [Cryobacterium sp. TmT2-59]TFD10845.1 glycosyltransferase family 1 protein [Cryobacterium sp. TMT1-21]TFD20518.1 glycosyltransferase family 1 protein [Cryobacterium sp. TMT4-10]TFD35200.1 glycosyltransferase family 1 protein [Cryobacterium sp. TMT2-10]